MKRKHTPKTHSKKQKKVMNFDFGKNWHLVVPHLENEKVKEAIKKGVNEHLELFPRKEEYIEHTAPCSYSSGDGWWNTRCEIWNNIMLKELMNETTELSKLFKDKYIQALESDLDDDDLEMDQWFKFHDEIMDYYFSWDRIKHKIETYILSGACHTYWRRVGLVLAELVLPDEKWKVRSGSNHTTIINESETMVFDLIYWSLGNRLEKLLFPVEKVYFKHGTILHNPPDEKDCVHIQLSEDETLGGQQAFEAILK